MSATEFSLLGEFRSKARRSGEEVHAARTGRNAPGRGREGRHPSIFDRMSESSTRSAATPLRPRCSAPVSSGTGRRFRYPAVPLSVLRPTVRGCPDANTSVTRHGCGRSVGGDRPTAVGRVAARVPDWGTAATGFPATYRVVIPASRHQVGRGQGHGAHGPCRALLAHPASAVRPARTQDPVLLQVPQEPSRCLWYFVRLYNLCHL